MTFTLPIMLDWGTVPQKRLSEELPRQSPITKYWSAGMVWEWMLASACWQEAVNAGSHG